MQKNGVRIIASLMLVILSNSNNCNSHPLLDSILLDESYDARIPLPSKGIPLKVQLTMELDGIDMLHDDEKEISIYFGMEERWLDARLNRTHEGVLASESTVDDLVRVWNPDVQFINAKDSPILKSVLRVYGDGQVVKYSKWRVMVPCQMTFFYFPFDKHICNFKLLSLEYSEKELTYVWKDGSKSLKVDSKISESNLFTLKGYRTANFTSSGIAGNHSGLEFQLFLTRKTERNFPFFYFPAIALTILSFCSLWMGSTLHGIYLSLASFLTMVIFYVLVQAELPTYFEMGMLDHYYFVCLNLIINAVIINIIMHGYLTPGNTKMTTSSSNGTINTKVEMKRFKGIVNGDVEDSMPTIETGPEDHIHHMSRFKRLVYFKGCKSAKLHLPIGFTVVNCIYWIWMLIAALQFPSGFQKV